MMRGSRFLTLTAPGRSLTPWQNPPDVNKKWPYFELPNRDFLGSILLQTLQRSIPGPT